MSSADSAAWMQAIGSILAICASIYISANQFQDATTLQREALRNETKRKYEALIGLIEAALEDFNDTLNALKSQEPERWFEENSTKELMEEFYQAFLQISPLDMPSSVGARALVRLRDRFKTAAWNANAAIEHGISSQTEYMQCVAAMEHNLSDVRSDHKTFVDELAKA